jgi:hypothetical protein
VAHFSVEKPAQFRVETNSLEIFTADLSDITLETPWR